MEIPFGQYAGQSVAEMVLRKPFYIRWMLDLPEIYGRMEAVYREARRLIRIFDEKPFRVKCSGFSCKNPATRFSVYGSSIDPQWWCDACDPYSAGACPGKLRIIRTYLEALAHAGFRRDGDDLEKLILTMAEAKGFGLQSWDADVFLWKSRWNSVPPPVNAK